MLSHAQDALTPFLAKSRLSMVKLESSAEQSLMEPAASQHVNSSKTLAILDALVQVRARGEKTVIFSSFTSYLDILQAALVMENYVVARIDGSLNQKRRAAAIDMFTHDDRVTVLQPRT